MLNSKMGVATDEIGGEPETAHEILHKQKDQHQLRLTSPQALYLDFYHEPFSSHKKKKKKEKKMNNRLKKRELLVRFLLVTHIYVYKKEPDNVASLFGALSSR